MAYSLLPWAESLISADLFPNLPNSNDGETYGLCNRQGG